ncbi:PQQ-dependent sugar dehydrogenase [Plantactinospora sp. KLBMP9567]|uniref:PQQ-dependent sugar dehydrogenase n=1 Tax=Plantactinospora sp. KLBMP9567 TaxID=3085900 RepID=UPI002981ACC6|nr:PQQ-dependent sugar dehydrogenase [Plantactinospora sp. KLBMP9567]MDW5322753.1 PQQ-dependent sugar dehydrogenase [Plantactinospora sp. KLBMP9567]
MRSSRLLVTGAALAVVLGGAGFAVADTTSAPGGGMGVLAAGEFDFGRPQTVATNLQAPWGMAFLPDGSALVAERDTARVLQIRPGQTPQQVATISGVSPGGEAGLLGLAVSPSYASDRYVYAYFTSASDNRIVRFRLDAPQTQTPILTGLARANFHDGGRIAFGPDGMLYAGVGDAGQTANSQNPSSRNGKILRMRPDGSAPPDNPTAGSLVYSLGHRNVQGLAWDAQGRLYASEFGQNSWDEVNYIVPGGNYGWPTVEGQGNDPRFRNPIVTWSTAEASPSGAAIDGNMLFVAALRGTRLWQVPLNGSGGVAGSPTAQLTGQYGRLRTVERAPDGSLWVATSNRDGRGTPAATDDRILRFPPVGATPEPTATTRPPTSSPTPSVPPTSTPPPSGTACTATYRQINQWQGGFQGEVTVRNNGTGTLNGWTVRWTFANGQTIGQLWNGTLTASGSSVTVRNVSWNGTLGVNGSASFGFQGSWTGTNTPPSDLTCTSP